MNLIESYQEIDEENRLQSTLARKVEYLTTVAVLNNYSSGRKKCIDVGCGVGIYALYLDKIGIQTTAIDVVPDHIARLNEIVSEQNSNVDAHIGNALDLSAYKSDTYDIVLCLGPLYHLLTSEAQDKCIEECKRLVKPDGVMLFSYISPYSVFPCAIRGDSKRMSAGLIDKIVCEHKIEADSPYCFWTDNYYHDPTEIEALLIRHERQITSEDIQWMTEDELIHLSKITSDQLRTVSYLEIGRWYSGTNKTGMKAKTDKRKAKKYLKKCLASAKRGRDDKYIEMARNIIQSLK